MSDDELDEHLTGIIKTLNTAEWRDARNRLRQAIDEAVRAEREACASIVDEWVEHFTSARVAPGNLARNFFGGGLDASEKIAVSIRNRSDNP